MRPLSRFYPYKKMRMTVGRWPKCSQRIPLPTTITKKLNPLLFFQVQRSVVRYERNEVCAAPTLAPFFKWGHFLKWTFKVLPNQNLVPTSEFFDFLHRPRNPYWGSFCQVSEKFIHGLIFYGWFKSEKMTPKCPLITRDLLGVKKSSKVH